MACLKVSFVIIGTIIGAGFASGQEIYTFFNVYGIKGLFGICISCLLLGIVIFKTLSISLKAGKIDYNKFIKTIIPDRLQNNKILLLTINNIINIFLAISFFIMVTGFASYFFQEFQISKIYGGVIIAILSFITFSKNIDGIVKTNTYLIPALIILVIWLGFKQIDFNNIVFTQETLSNKNWLLSSVLYASYNSIILIPILISLKDMIKNKKQITTIFIMVTIVILVAIFTSAISAGYGFLTNCTKKRKSYVILSMLICTISILISTFSFSGLINLLYPIFGYLGIIQIIFILTLKKTKRFDISNI